jgi:hypothetical protein
MFNRILVAIKNPQREKETCDTAINLANDANDIDARLLWVHILKDGESPDHQLLQSFRTQAMEQAGIESDAAQLQGDLVTILHDQILKWSPDILVVSKKYLQELLPLFTEDQDNESYLEKHEHTWAVLMVTNANDLEQELEAKQKVELSVSQFNPSS